MGQERRRSIVYSQNFFKHQSVARHIVEWSTLDPRDLVLEIGPGEGVLTRELADRCWQVMAVEKDPALARRLGRQLGESPNVTVFEADIVEFPLPVTPYKVFANIPFNITAAIMTRLTESPNPPDEAALVMQREAAERFTGSPRGTLSAALLHPWFEMSIGYRFQPSDFVPPPRVDVVLLRFNKRGPPLVSRSKMAQYRDFVTVGFTAWQPTVYDAFREVFGTRRLSTIAASGLNLHQKPSEMPLEDWPVLFAQCMRNASSRQREIVRGAEERLRAQQQKLTKRHRSRVQH